MQLHLPQNVIIAMGEALLYSLLSISTFAVGSCTSLMLLFQDCPEQLDLDQHSQFQTLLR